jgi:hypothetical protein
MQTSTAPTKSALVEGSSHGAAVRARFRERVSRQTPPTHEPLARNQAITAFYAGVYLDAPGLFPWAGMAAFASSQVGELLARAFPPREGGRGLARRAERALTRRLAGDLVELVRETNDAVFHDVAWALTAFTARDGGLEVALEGLAGLTTHGLLARALVQLDEAQREPAGPRREALVWGAARDMLEHEQRVSVDPRFVRFSPGARALLTLVARGSFPVEAGSTTRGRSFLAYHLARGRLAPDLASFDERWMWMQAEVLPCFRALSAREPVALARRLERERRVCRG